jgi:hypothetical protein
MAAGIGRQRCLPNLTVGEVLSHVQGESLKGSAVVHGRLLNSPTTRAPGGRLNQGVVAMDQPYSHFADWLSKFHASPEPIQALWLVAIPVTVLGLAWLALRGIVDLVRLARGEHQERGGRLSHRWRGHLVYGVYQDDQGRWMVYWHGRAPQEVDWENPPPELVGRGHVIQGVFRRPEA